MKILLQFPDSLRTMPEATLVGERCVTCANAEGLSLYHFTYFLVLEIIFLLQLGSNPHCVPLLI